MKRTLVVMITFVVALAAWSNTPAQAAEITILVNQGALSGVRDLAAANGLRLPEDGELPWNRWNVSIFYDGPADTWLGGLDVGAVVHWIGQYEDDNIDLVGTYDGGTPKPQTPRTDPTTGLDGLHARKVAMWTTFDLILNYTFNLPPPAPAEVPGFAKDGGKNVRMKDGKEKNVVPVSTAEYGCSNWKWWLNNTTITLGMQNVTDEDPPFVAGAFENQYDESLTTIKGRFWYVGLKKRF